MTLRNIKFTLFVILCACMGILTANAQFCKKTRTLNMEEYLAKYGSESDRSPAVVKALQDCRRLGAKRLVFPKGIYHLKADSLNAFMTHISNNGSYQRRFAFDLTGIRNLEIDGCGSTLLLKGYVCPFYVNKAEGICLRNFLVDYERTFNSEGHIEAVTDSTMTLRFSNEYPYFVDDKHHLHFIDDEGTEYPWYYLLEFDPKLMETAYMVPDQWTGANLYTEDLGQGRVMLCRKGLRGTPGNVINFGIARRTVPAITITDSRNVSVRNITLYHAGGMGVIAQRTRDITIDSLNILPAPGKDRVVSVGADATHFVNCTGRLRMYNSHLAQQTDDATNIHGVYYRIADVLADGRIMVELANDAQYGFDLFHSKPRIEFVSAKSLITYGHGKVKSYYTISDNKFMLTLSTPLPQGVAKGDVIAPEGDYPDVHIKGCYFGNNRARGLLLGSRARMLIEDCVFHTPGAALLLEGDGRYWFEQAGVRNVIIRNNTFDNCNYGVWGSGTIETGSGIDSQYYDSSFYNRNLLIENNTFRIHRAAVLNLYSVDGVTFRNNRIVTTSEPYPCKVKADDKDALFRLKSCKNVSIDY